MKQHFIKALTLATALAVPAAAYASSASPLDNASGSTDKKKDDKKKNDKKKDDKKKEGDKK